MIQLEPLMGIEDVCKELGINRWFITKWKKSIQNIRNRGVFQIYEH